MPRRNRNKRKEQYIDKDPHKISPPAKCAISESEVTSGGFKSIMHVSHPENEVIDIETYKKEMSPQAVRMHQTELHRQRNLSVRQRKALNVTYKDDYTISVRSGFDSSVMFALFGHLELMCDHELKPTFVMALRGDLQSFFAYGCLYVFDFCVRGIPREPLLPVAVQFLHQNTPKPDLIYKINLENASERVKKSIEESKNTDFSRCQMIIMNSTLTQLSQSKSTSPKRVFLTDTWHFLQENLKKFKITVTTFHTKHEFDASLKGYPIANIKFAETANDVKLYNHHASITTPSTSWADLHLTYVVNEALKKLDARDVDGAILIKAGQFLPNIIPENALQELKNRSNSVIISQELCANMIPLAHAFNHNKSLEKFEDMQTFLWGLSEFPQIRAKQQKEKETKKQLDDCLVDCISMPTRFASLQDCEKLADMITDSHFEVKENLSIAGENIYLLKGHGCETVNEMQQKLTAQHDQLVLLEKQIPLHKEKAIELKTAFHQTYEKTHEAIIRSLQKNELAEALKLKVPLDKIVEEYKTLSLSLQQCEKSANDLNSTLLQNITEQRQAIQRHLRKQSPVEVTLKATPIVETEDEEALQKLRLEQRAQFEKRRQEYREQKTREMNARLAKENATQKRAELDHKISEQTEASAPSKLTPLDLGRKTQIIPILSIEHLKSALSMKVATDDELAALIEKNALLELSAEVMEDAKQVGGLPTFPREMARNFRDAVFHCHDFEFKRDEVRAMSEAFVQNLQNRDLRFLDETMLLKIIDSPLCENLVTHKVSPPNERICQKNFETARQELSMLTKEGSDLLKYPNELVKAALRYAEARVSTYYQGLSQCIKRRLKKNSDWKLIEKALKNGPAIRHRDFSASDLAATQLVQQRQRDGLLATTTAGAASAENAQPVAFRIP